jgi:hypothetical protein
MPRAVVMTLGLPLILILVSIALILEKILRNPLYGFVRHTLCRLMTSGIAQAGFAVTPC